jgi:KUP system potassium uptake protein
VITGDLGMLVFEQTQNRVTREAPEKNAQKIVIYLESNASRANTTEPAQDGTSNRPSLEQLQVPDKLLELQKAYNSQVVYIVGKEQMRISNDTVFVRRIALEAFLWLGENTRTSVQAFNMEVEKPNEVGFVKEL